MCQRDTDAVTLGHCVREKFVRDICDIWDVGTRVILYAPIQNGKGIKRPSCFWLLRSCFLTNQFIHILQYFIWVFTVCPSTCLWVFNIKRVCLYVLCGHLLGKGWPLGSRLWCLLWVCHFPIGILGQVWYLIVSIPDLCTLTYFYYSKHW